MACLVNNINTSPNFIYECRFYKKYLSSIWNWDWSIVEVWFSFLVSCFMKCNRKTLHVQIKMFTKVPKDDWTHKANALPSRLFRVECLATQGSPGFGKVKHCISTWKCSQKYPKVMQILYLLGVFICISTYQDYYPNCVVNVDCWCHNYQCPSCHQV